MSSHRELFVFILIEVAISKVEKKTLKKILLSETTLLKVSKAALGDFVDK